MSKRQKTKVRCTSYSFGKSASGSLPSCTLAGHELGPNTKLINIHPSVSRTTNETRSQHKLMMNQIHSKRIDQNVELIPCKSRLLRFRTAMSNQIHVLDLVTPIIHKPFIKKHRILIVFYEQIRLLEAVRETSQLHYYL